MERKDYERTHWEDRIIDDKSGEVMVEGTVFDETNMNNVEDGIVFAHNEVGLVALTALNQSMQNNKELDKIANQRILQGRGTISNNISDNGYFRTSEPFKTISLEGFSQINAPDYDVVLTPTESDNLGAVGFLEVYDKTRNGFKVRMTGSAKSVSFLWTLINPNV